MKSRAVFLKGFCLACILTLFSVCYMEQHPIEAQGINHFQFKVFVEINCKDIQTKTLIESWIKRELRSLPDVSVIHNHRNAGAVISIAVVETPFGEIKRFSIGYSYYLLYFDDNTPCCSVPVLAVAAGTTSLHLEGVCKQIIASFDINLLEPARKSVQGFNQ
ncbi:MAG: hypothetical protein OXD54_18780 [Candidatus Poribacteria bacterium]|nr:hypothetical protein [Candidatus Poribacteria bacterium]